MGDIAQRGNRLTKKINYDKAYVKSRSLVKDVYDAVAPKHSLGQKGKPHSSKEGRTAAVGRTVRDIGKILSPERDKKFGGGRTNLLEQLGRVEAEPSNPNRRAEISRVHGELNRGYAKGGVVRRAKKFKTHGKDVPTMAAQGGRIGLKGGSKSKPWGTGPKPGTHEFLMQQLHKPRKGKAVGGAMSAARRAAKTFIERAGGSEKGKPHSTKEGRIASGKRKISRFLQSRALKPKPGPKAPSRPKKTWPPKHKDLLQRYPKMPQPHKSPGDIPYIPMPKHDPTKPKKYQPAAKGGRIGFKKGGSDKKWIQKAVDPKHKGYCTPMTKKTCTPARKALARTFKKKAKTGW